MRKRLPRIRLSRHGLTVSAQSLAALPGAGCAHPRYFSIQLRICIVGVSVVVYMLLGLATPPLPLTTMYARPFLICIVAHATAVLATCRIEYPGGVEYWWVSSRPNVVGWSCEANAPAEYYNLVLQNYDNSLLAEPTIVARNVSRQDCVKVIHDLPPDLTEGRGYYLQLADANLATVRAVSEPFEIKSKDASYPSTCMNSTSTTPLLTPTCASLTPASTLFPSTPTSAYLPPISTPSTPSANLVAGATGLETGERRSPIWDMPDWLAFFFLGLLMF